MRRKKIVIAGGTGFLGQCLTRHYAARNHELVILSRSHHVDHGTVRYSKWDGKHLGMWAGQLEGAEALINLTGKSVDCRYTKKNKQLIYDSRLEATHVLAKAVLRCKQPPEIWVNASSATIYRHSVDKPMDEATGELGADFSVDVCRKWERTFYEAKTPGTRKVVLRIAIVLGRKGGALVPFRNLVRMGFGGKQGKGDQCFSWLHEADFAGIVDFVICNENMTGIYNVSAP